MESVRSLDAPTPSAIVDHANRFLRKGATLGNVHLMPVDLLVGGFYICYVAHNIKKFIDSFFDNQTLVTTVVREVKSLRKRIFERIIYAVQAVSSSMLFVDWGIDKKWFTVDCMTRSAFKATAHSMSILFWSYKCASNIQNLITIPELIDLAEKSHLYKRVELQPEVYKEWINFFSNFSFVLASAIQVGCMLTATTVPLASVSLLVSLSMGLMAAGLIVDLCSDSSKKIEAVRLTFSHVQTNKGYTLLK